MGDPDDKEGSFMCQKVREEKWDPRLVRQGVRFEFPSGTLTSFPLTVSIKGFDAKKLATVLETLARCVRGIDSCSWSLCEFKRLEIIIDFHTLNKSWCKKQNYIGACSCNTGYTEQTQGKQVIYVYREQDWRKVLLHELIHAYQWERNVPSHPKIKNAFEGFVEAWALFMQEQLFVHQSTFLQGLSKEERELQEKLCTWMMQIKKQKTKEWTNATAYMVLKRYLLAQYSWSELETCIRSAPEAKRILNACADAISKDLLSDSTNQSPAQCIRTVSYTVHQVPVGFRSQEEMQWSSSASCPQCRVR